MNGSNTMRANVRLPGGGPLTRICNLVIITIALALLIISLVMPGWFAINQTQSKVSIISAPCSFGWGFDRYSCNKGEATVKETGNKVVSDLADGKFVTYGGLRAAAEECNRRNLLKKEDKMDLGIVQNVSIAFLVTAWGAVVLLIGTGVVTCLTICINKAPLRYAGTATACLAATCGFISMGIVWIVSFFVPLGGSTFCSFEPVKGGADTGNFTLGSGSGCQMCSPLLAPSLYSCVCGLFLVPICVGQMWQTKNPPPPVTTTIIDNRSTPSAGPKVVNNTTTVNNAAPSSPTPAPEPAKAPTTAAKPPPPRPTFKPVAKALPKDAKTEPAGEEMKKTKPAADDDDDDEEIVKPAAKPEQKPAASGGAVADDDDDDDDEIVKK